MYEPGQPIDTAAAQAYEKYLVPTLNRPVAEKVVKLAEPQPGERVLDVACGTGIAVRIVAPYLAPGGSVVGLDFDPAMIAVAHSIVSAPKGLKIDWHCASAQDMPFADGTFDIAFCLQGLQYFPDCVAALTEIRRVIKPRGRLIAVVWSSLEGCKGQHAIAQALERHNVEVSAILKAYSLGDPDRVSKAAVAAGFQQVEIFTSSAVANFASVRQFVEAFAAGSVSSRAAISKVPEHQRPGFIEDVEMTLRRFEGKDGVALPLEYLVLIACP